MSSTEYQRVNLLLNNTLDAYLIAAGGKVQYIYLTVLLQLSSCDQQSILFNLPTKVYCI